MPGTRELGCNPFCWRRINRPAPLRPCFLTFQTQKLLATLLQALEQLGFQNTFQQSVALDRKCTLCVVGVREEIPILVILGRILNDTMYPQPDVCIFSLLFRVEVQQVLELSV